MRVLAAAPGAHGIGVDIRGLDIARGREDAGQRGLADRVTFIEGPAADHAGKADAVINCGAYHAFGAIPQALRALRALVNPGGRVLFGAEVWDRTPTERELAAMWPGTSPDTCLYLPDVVDATVAAGFRPLRVQAATRDEWDEFESGLATGAEEWLLANPRSPGGRAGQGQARRAPVDLAPRAAYLTLGVPGPEPGTARP